MRKKHTRKKVKRILRTINEILNFIEKDNFYLHEWYDACYKAGFIDSRTITNYLRAGISLGVIKREKIFSFRKANKELIKA